MAAVEIQMDHLLVNVLTVMFSLLMAIIVKMLMSVRYVPYYTYVVPYIIHYCNISQFI